MDMQFHWLRDRELQKTSFLLAFRETQRRRLLHEPSLARPLPQQGGKILNPQHVLEKLAR